MPAAVLPEIPKPKEAGAKRHAASFDANNDGKIDESEQAELELHMTKREATLSFFRAGFIIAVIAFFIHIAVSSALTYVVVKESKETKAQTNGGNQPVLTSTDGTALIATAEATEDVELYLAPVLPDDVLHRIKSMTITANGVTVDGAPNGVDEDNDPTSVEFGLRVTGYAKVSDTEIVFSTGDGSNLRVKGGVASLEYKGTAFDQGTYSACGKRATCSSLDISGAFDVAAFKAKADAALAAAGYRVDVNMSVAELADNSTSRVRRKGKRVDILSTKLCVQNPDSKKRSTRTSESKIMKYFEDFINTAPNYVRNLEGRDLDCYLYTTVGLVAKSDILLWEEIRQRCRNNGGNCRQNMKCGAIDKWITMDTACVMQSDPCTSGEF